MTRSIIDHPESAADDRLDGYDSGDIRRPARAASFLPRACSGAGLQTCRTCHHAELRGATLAWCWVLNASVDVWERCEEWAERTAK